ncbi:MAG: hypothetical protein ACJAYR_002579 [Sneathiella sp.]|jgi:hypothetical protein
MSYLTLDPKSAADPANVYQRRNNFCFNHFSALSLALFPDALGDRKVDASKSCRKRRRLHIFLYSRTDHRNSHPDDSYLAAT